MSEEQQDQKALWHVPQGVIDFVELDQIEQKQTSAEEVAMLTRQFNQLVLNVMSSDLENKTDGVEVVTHQFTERIQEAMKPRLMKMLNGLLEKKVSKRENGLDFGAEDYALTPDESKPATWQFRLAETPGKITVKQLNNAAALLSSSSDENLPKGASPSVKKRIRAEYAKLGVPNEKIPAAVKSSLTFTKDKGGRWRWTTIYSNCYRDQDNPPEIISRKSHEKFVKMVEAGITPYPELWLWHLENTKFGTSDHVSFTKDGFAIASGLVDTGKEHIAENLSEYDDLKTSHGMPSWSVLRNDPDDDSVITSHVTREITALPGWAAANKLTGTSFLKKETKMLDEQQEKFLREAGYTDDQLAEFRKSIEGKSQAAQDEGIEEKSVSPGSDEIAKAIAEATAPMLEVIKNMSSKIVQLEVQVKALSDTDETKVAALAATTPASSLSDMVQRHLMTALPESTPTPDEQKAKPLVSPTAPVTGIPFLDGVIAKSANGSVA